MTLANRRRQAAGLKRKVSEEVSEGESWIMLLCAGGKTDDFTLMCRVGVRLNSSTAKGKIRKVE